MVWKEAEFLKKPQGEMFSMAFKGRYMLLMMGCFAIYCGFIYNDCFAVATNIFGSKWGYRVTNGTIALEATPISTDHNNVYPFGMDPAWRIVDNELLMFNSLKMKMSVIMGITHMLLGLSLKVINALHFKSKTDLYFEAIPQVGVAIENYDFYHARGLCLRLFMKYYCILTHVDSFDTHEEAFFFLWFTGPHSHSHCAVCYVLPFTLAGRLHAGSVRLHAVPHRVEVVH